MAQMLRRHWRVALTAFLLVLVTSGIVLMHRSQAQPAPAAAGTAQQSGLSASTYDQVQKLRSELLLTNEHLAAYGCTQEMAENLLRALVNWVNTNSVALQDADQAAVQARRDLRDTLQLINIGPRNQATLDRVPTLQRQVTVSMKQRRDLIQGAIAPATAQLGPSQGQSWQTTRTNARVPQRYRYIPGLSTEQLKTLSNAVRSTSSEDSPQLQAVEQQTLSPPQREALATARLNIRNLASAISAAETTVMPVPQELQASASQQR